MLKRSRNWLAYEDGSYEPVDPRGNLNLKKRGPDREDWWVVEKDQDWSPPRGKQRAMNAPSRTRAGGRAGAKADASTPSQRKQSILSGGLAAEPRKQAKAKAAKSFMEGEWDWMGNLPGAPDQGTYHETLPARLPKGGGVSNQDPLIKSAHAAARLTPVTAKGKSEVRLLDKGLDPNVPVAVQGQGDPGQGRQAPDSAPNAIPNALRDAREMEAAAKKAGLDEKDNILRPGPMLDKELAWEQAPEPGVSEKISKGLGDLADKASAGIAEAWEEGIPAGQMAAARAKDALLSRETWFKAGEAWKRDDVAKLHKDHKEVIEHSAKDNGIDPDLLRAIIKEEVSHQKPIEKTLEGWGRGDSVGPCQIRVSLWGKKYGLTREELQDETINIATAAKILGEEKKRLEMEGYEVTPAILATRYNQGSAIDVTDYGVRIQEYMREFKRKEK